MREREMIIQSLCFQDMRTFHTLYALSFTPVMLPFHLAYKYYNLLGFKQAFLGKWIKIELHFDVDNLQLK